MLYFVLSVGLEYQVYFLSELYLLPLRKYVRYVARMEF